MKLIFLLMPLFILVILIKILLSKSISERLMLFSSIGNYAIVLLTAMSMFENRESYFDIAFIYALFGFVNNLVINKLKEIK